MEHQTGRLSAGDTVLSCRLTVTFSDNFSICVYLYVTIYPLKMMTMEDTISLFIHSWTNCAPDADQARSSAQNL